MKKYSLILIAMLMLSVAAVMVFSPIKAVSQKKISMAYVAVPDSVASILRNSCGSCHGDGGGMAMSVWNLPAWDTYPAVKQAKKASAMCDAMTKGSMPPGSAKKRNPEKIPTAAQIAIVCNWANSLNKK
jgi:hypothetical protein